MNLKNLITACQVHIRQASERLGAGFPNQALARLVSLREFLNEQPNLEAGGACESDESSNGS